ncbi:MAG: hypothetical protein AAB531_02655 [Patescibacteria group bacterium]
MGDPKEIGEHTHEISATYLEEIIGHDGNVAKIIEVDTGDLEITEHLVGQHTDPDNPYIERLYTEKPNLRRFLVSFGDNSFLPVEMDFFKRKQESFWKLQAERKKCIEQARSPYGYFLSVLKEVGEYSHSENGDRVVFSMAVQTIEPNEEASTSTFYIVSDLIKCEGDFDIPHLFDLPDSTILEIGFSDEEHLEISPDAALIVSSGYVALRQATIADLDRFKDFFDAATTFSDDTPIVKGGVIDEEIFPLMPFSRIN